VAGRRFDFLSRAWSERAVALSQEILPARPGLDMSVAVVSEGAASYTTRYLDGRLAAVTDGIADDAALLLRRPRAVDLASWFQRGAGMTVTAATALSVDAGHTWAPSPPLAHATACAGHCLPRRDGASVRAQLRMRDAAGGDISAFLCFEDGRLGAFGWGELVVPDVVVDGSWRAILETMHGARALSSLLDEATVGGDLDALRVLYELVGSDEMLAAAREWSPTAAFLARLAIVTTTREYDRFRAELTTLTTPTRAA
jgi:hypothetical protein